MRLDDGQALLHSRDPVVEQAIGAGGQVQRFALTDIAIGIFAGREHLGATCPTHGCQGYRGQGWRAHAMASLLKAFQPRASAAEMRQGHPGPAPRFAGLGAAPGCRVGPPGLGHHGSANLTSVPTTAAGGPCRP